MVNSKLRRHKVMEKVIKKLMAGNLPPRFKFKDTYASIDVPQGYQQYLPTQQQVEAEFNEMITEEEELPTVDAAVDDVKVISSNLYVQSNTGNVGIGTASPGYMLDVTGSANVAALTATSLDVSGATNTVNLGLTHSLANRTTDTVFYSSDGNYIYKNTAAGLRTALDVPSASSAVFTGNVGVGTASPLAPLHIRGDNCRLVIADSSENDADTNAFNCGIAFVDNTYDGTLTYVGNPAAGMGFFIGHLSSSSKEVNMKNLTGELSFGTRNTHQALYINNDGNVGINKTNPSAKLDVNGTIQTPLLNLNGTTMSKAPRVIHIEDTRSGCPPTWAANTPIMQYSLTLSRTAYVYVSVTTILTYHTRSDCYIYFNNTHQQSHLTAEDSTAWNPVNITAGGSLGAGTHTIKFMCNRANVVGCQGDWGGMQILVFEQ